MLKSYQIGQTRIELSKLLSEFCGTPVPPALLIENRGDFRGGRNLGFAFSWFIDVDINHPLYNCGSGHTMTDFVRLHKKGLKISKQGEELFLVKEAAR